MRATGLSNAFPPVGGEGRAQAAATGTDRRPRPGRRAI